MFTSQERFLTREEEDRLPRDTRASMACIGKVSQKACWTAVVSDRLAASSCVELSVAATIGF